MIKTTIIGFGDSITHGYGVNPSFTFTHRLEKLLPTYYPAILWNIYNVSKNKLTTREAAKMLKNSILELRPNIVFMMFGTNDCANITKLNRSLDEFYTNLKSMIEHLHQHNNRTGLNNCIPIPVLITPPPISDKEENPERLNATLATYVDRMIQVAEEYNCPIIDFYHKIMDLENYDTYLSEDGFHLSEEGYDLLFDLVFSEFTKLINYQGVIKERE